MLVAAVVEHIMEPVEPVEPVVVVQVQVTIQLQPMVLLILGVAAERRVIMVAEHLQHLVDLE
jgi:hypothetical protein